MHLTGKIFAALTLCLAVAAIILSAQTLDRQNEWNRRIEAARTGYQNAIAKIPETESKVKQLGDELSRARLDWGQHWDNVQVSMRNPQQGQITIEIGSNNKLRASGNAGATTGYLYAFQPSDGGEMTYVGEFQVPQVDPNRAALQLTRAPREGETNGWNMSQRWRFRDALPAGRRAQVGELLLELTLIEQRIKDRQLNLQIQQKSAQAARNLLDQRMKELNGDPNLPAAVGAEYRDGLVESLKAAETRRDAALAEVQQLRVELFELYQKFETLMADNRQLEASLNEQSGVTPAEEVTEKENSSAPK